MRYDRLTVALDRATKVLLQEKYTDVTYEKHVKALYAHIDDILPGEGDGASGEPPIAWFTAPPMILMDSDGGGAAKWCSETGCLECSRCYRRDTKYTGNQTWCIVPRQPRDIPS